MIRILLFIKHNLTALWRLIEWLNSLIFKFMQGRKFKSTISSTLQEFKLPGFTFRLLNASDLPLLKLLIDSQTPVRLEFFKPHGFDEKALQRTYQNPAFIMFGVFINTRMVGYFFLRCFWNRRCFVGRLIDQSYEGKGIGRVMNNIMYNIGWRAGFRALSTISKTNHMVMKSHKNNPNMFIIKELQDDYLLVEFKRDKNAIEENV